MTVTQNKNLVTLKYVLSQLPSSQHRAGLAGLILIIWWLQEQPEFQHSVDAEFKIVALNADRVTLQFNLAPISVLVLRNGKAKRLELRVSKNLKKSNARFMMLRRIQQSLLPSIYIQI